MLKKIQELLGKEADELLSYKAKFPKEQLNLPGPDFVDRIHLQSDRSPNVLKNLNWILNKGRLAGRVMFQFFLLIRELNTLQVHRLHQTQFTSIRKILLNLQLKAAVMPVHQHSVCWNGFQKICTQNSFHFKTQSQ